MVALGGVAVSYERGIPVYCHALRNEVPPHVRRSSRRVPLVMPCPPAETPPAPTQPPPASGCEVGGGGPSQ